MKNTLDQIQGVLSEAERGLQQVIVDAVQSGDYEAVDAGRRGQGRSGNSHTLNIGVA